MEGTAFFANCARLRSNIRCQGSADRLPIILNLAEFLFLLESEAKSYDLLSYAHQRSGITA